MFIHYKFLTLEAIRNPPQWNLNKTQVLWIFYVFLPTTELVANTYSLDVAGQRMSSHKEHNLLQNTECDRKIKLSCRSCIPGLTGRVLRRPVAPLSKRIWRMISVLWVHSRWQAFTHIQNHFCSHFGAHGCSKALEKHIHFILFNKNPLSQQHMKFHYCLSFYTFKREKVIKLKTIYFKMYVITCSLLNHMIYIWFTKPWYLFYLFWIFKTSIFTWK